MVAPFGLVWGIVGLIRVVGLWEAPGGSRHQNAATTGTKGYGRASRHVFDWQPRGRLLLAVSCPGLRRCIPAIRFRRWSARRPSGTSIANRFCSAAVRAGIVHSVMPKRNKPEAESDELKGWRQIAAFLGQPVSVAQRWAHSRMPAKRKGRYVHASREELNNWLAHESTGEPVQIATSGTDLSAELKRGLSFVRKQRRKAPKKNAA